MATGLLSFTDKGIYCKQADVYVDPWRPVKKALITHAHSDHARWGHAHYLSLHQNEHILKLRLGQNIHLDTVGFDEPVIINGVKITFHPAGHIWGSAQIRFEYKGEIWVVSGDYKVEDDKLSTPFEPIKCHHFITESTFGLPVFQWQKQADVVNQINSWWSDNASNGITSIITAYALGKAQRLLQLVDKTIGPVYVHGAVANVNEALIGSGASLANYHKISNIESKEAFKQALVITPASALGTSWVNKFHPYEIATVSGWMQIRGIKRRRNAGKGFVLSDHADWPGLLAAISSTGAQNIYVTHGYIDVFSKYLSELGYHAQVVKTSFAGESPDQDD